MFRYLCFVFLAPSLLWAQRLELAWPTPSTAWLEGRLLADFIQPTVSGVTTSGLFGCVRSEGRQFHEGLDIKPTQRDRGGEPTDPVYAALPGVVRYVNQRVGDSGYGRYVVLEHPGVSPAIYTLYAHLRSVDRRVTPGATVARGQAIGVMGRSAGGYTIPRDRAHLHFEMGVMVTRDFERWYRERKFGNPNHHGLWNGMNLMGFDPLDFLEKFRSRQVNHFDEYFAQMTPAVRLRIATQRIPDFVARYPSLLTRSIEGSVAGWEIAFNETGIPFRWTPLDAAAVRGQPLQEVRILDFDTEVAARCRCRSLVLTRRGARSPGPHLETVLQQLFGFR